jgi:hypothetical protein
MFQQSMLPEGRKRDLKQKEHESFLTSKMEIK